MPARTVIALARRLNARDTRLPDGAAPPLPPEAVQLRTRYGGFWFDGDDRKLTPWIRSNATWEEDVLRYLRSVVQPGMTIVDVGANVGFLTAILARLTGPAGTVHAFEPLPRTLLMLRANLWRHECANTTVHPYAVADAAGTVEMELDPDGASGAHIGHGFPVEAVTLDEALAGRTIDLLKVDVEGAESMVLRGARALIERSPRLDAVVEFHRSRHLDGSTPDEALDLYEELGFAVHLLSPDGRITPASRDAVLAAVARVDTLNLVLRKRG